MGLDMYLVASKYVSGYKHSDEEEKNIYQKLVLDLGISAYVDPDHPSATLEFTVAYWRKANHIHNWFVQNVQGGTDDCGEYDVSRDDLTKLRALCQKVLEVAKEENGPVKTGTTYKAGGVTENYKAGTVVANSDTVAAILPTTGGFFFGSTDYDEYYLEDIKDTVKQLDRVLAMPKGWYLQYHSSW